MRRRWLGLTMTGVAAALAANAGCSVDVATETGRPSGEASQVVGANGGTVATADGNVELDIPEGALPADTTITIQPNTTAPAPAGADVVGTAYTFGPDGLKFLKPITVTLAFDPAKLPAGAPTSAIVVYTAPDGSKTYSPLPTTVKDATHVSATTTHFSTDVTAVDNGTAVDAGTDGGGTQVCVSTGAGSTCANGGGGCPPPPTCASSSPCANYPGSTVQSCTDTGSGFNATCCFAETAPTCFSVGAGCASSGAADASVAMDSGVGSGGGGGGSGGGCASPPTCATSNPCGGYQNATVQSCTDNTSGFEAVCCLPAGTPLPGSTGSSDGGTVVADASAPRDASIDSGSAGGSDASAGADAGAAVDASAGTDSGGGLFDASVGIDSGGGLIDASAGDAGTCPYVVCNGVCTDITTDPNNCGTCGHVCTSGTMCINMQCAPVIDAGAADASTD